MKIGNRQIDHHNLIIWIILVTVVWYVFICELVSGVIFDGVGRRIFDGIIDGIGYEPDAMKFVLKYYVGTIIPLVAILVYTGVTKRNRFILRSFLPSHPGNKASLLLLGLLVGFAMNFGCILCAMANGDIHLFLQFAAAQIPFYCYALFFVFIQSASEELWCRGFMQERINVKYPLWVALLVNGVFFGLLHALNPGVTVFAVVEIIVCGVSFAISKWVTGSIWFPIGVHTAWNFTQNLIFGLPNSGLVSEASIFGLDAATARSSMVYSVSFGVEGAIPALIADALLGIICLLIAVRQGRLPELMQKQVTPGKDPEGPQPLPDNYKRAAEPEAGEWHYIDEEEN